MAGGLPLAAKAGRGLISGCRESRVTRTRRRWSACSAAGEGGGRTLGSLDGVGRRWYPTPGPVAQLVEQETFNLTVRGSSPRGLTVKKSKIR